MPRNRPTNLRKTATMSTPEQHPNTHAPNIHYVAMPATPARPRSDKSRLVAILLAFFVGVLGVHRFYVGKIGTGILWLFTLGFLGVGALIDIIIIAAGSFKDADGLRVTEWSPDN